MPSYVITGASRGIGWGFVKHLSEDPSNTVIGLVRNALPTIECVKSELPDRKNIHIIQADLTDTPALKKAASDTATITGGTLDYLIGNAAYLATYDQFDSPGNLLANSSPEEFTKQFHSFMDTNVLAQIFLYEAFLPLLLKGKTKKILSISSAMGDPDFNREWEHDHAIFYSTSKAALNMVNVKFGAQYKKDGVLFISMCPGIVDTGYADNITPEQGAKLQEVIGKFQAYSPAFKGAYEPVESVKMMLGVLDKLSIENGDQGKYLSHLGAKRWLP
ncbi:NAD(P)-binding protein [Lentithecium fluviatile CBS 122367]|uniref:NAD(P)-binding protein n=1 Tax=Lentithecium fluviatile CBS 122367 TaxID=1168545 RepID=A0A6G1IIC6_9PLEO|nr:NAD(P)-binding protein [Lentithecium fluviatile CBS 122367]